MNLFDHTFISPLKNKEAIDSNMQAVRAVGDKEFMAEIRGWVNDVNT